jgi:hypothetical protein
MTNSAESFGANVFDGDGDAFPSDQGNARPLKLLYHT